MSPRDAVSESATVDRQLDFLATEVSRLDTMMIDPREFGRLEGEVKSLAAQVAGVQTDVKLLLEMANKSKGGLWAGMAIASGFGSVAGWILHTLLGN